MQASLDKPRDVSPPISRSRNGGVSYLSLWRLDCVAVQFSLCALVAREFTRQVCVYAYLALELRGTCL